MKIKILITLLAFEVCGCKHWGDGKEESIFATLYTTHYVDGVMQTVSKQEIYDAHVAFNERKFCNALFNGTKSDCIYYANGIKGWWKLSNNQNEISAWDRSIHEIDVDSTERLKTWAREMFEAFEKWDEVQARQLAERQRLATLQSAIQGRVALDAVDEYSIAARQGNRMQMCAQAGVCAAAFLQAKDEEDYDYWKNIEDSLTRSLGMPTYR